MEHAKWLEERRRGLGGSDAAAALGLSRYKSPFQLYLEKTGELTEDNQGLTVKSRGTRFEPILREIYSERTGRKVELAPMIQSDKIPFMFVSPDGLIPADKRYLEIKTARNRHEWGEPGTDELPQEYLIQVQHGLFVTKLQVADVFVAFSLDDIELYEVHADAELQEMVIDGERDFWKHVETLNPPELTTYEDVCTRYKRSTSKAITATEEIQNLAAALNSVKSLSNSTKNDEELLKKSIMAFMGEHDTLLNSEGKPIITWKSAKSSMTFDENKFAADNPELYNQYLKETYGSRRFLLKK